MAKSKKSSKNKNLPKIYAKKARSSILISDTKTIFNYLWLIFTKVLIFWYFNLEYHIWIKTNTSSYIINDLLSQLVFETKLNKIVTKTNLG